MTTAIDYLHGLRAAELERALGAAGAGRGRVLEIGGSDGFVASLLARRFDAVECVELAVPAETFFPVRRYDGRHLPYPDASFDLVYSSHVMEHVDDLAFMLREIARVLKPDGMALHVMPNAVWRIWTLLSYYPALPRLILATLRGQMAPSAGGAGSDRGRGLGWWLSRILIDQPHGEGGSALGEIFGFSRLAWRRRFVVAGWHVAARPLGLFYTGYMLRGGNLSLAARARLALLLGSSSTAYSVRPPRPETC